MSLELTLTINESIAFRKVKRIAQAYQQEEDFIDFILEKKLSQSSCK